MRRIASFALLASAVLLFSGCPTPGVDRPPVQIFPDMVQQPRYNPQRESAFFADRRTDRRPPLGTVARGRMEDTPFVTGVDGANYVATSPVPLTAEVMKTGQVKYNVYCAPCHDRTGSGRGIVAIRTQGWIPNNLLEDRIIAMNDGDIFNAITYGRRTMPGYRHQTTPEERWMIVAYVRALQRANHGVVGDVPAEVQPELR
jgi:mono/diheme cytochrome c family protein